MKTIVRPDNNKLNSRVSFYLRGSSYFKTNFEIKLEYVPNHMKVNVKSSLSVFKVSSQSYNLGSRS